MGCSAAPLFRDGCTSMHFGENQLSPGSIGISPLSTGHPPLLQQWWVRASTGSYPRFTLPMDSSPGFGPHPGDLSLPHAPALFRPGSRPRTRRPQTGSLSLRLRGSVRRLTSSRKPCGSRCRRRDELAGSFYKRHAVTRRDAPKRAREPSGFDCLRVRGFRFSFIPLPGCFSPFPHGTRALSVASGCFALEGGPPSFPQDFPCPVVLRYRPHRASRRRLPGSHRLRRRFPAASADTTG